MRTAVGHVVALCLSATGLSATSAAAGGMAPAIVEPAPPAPDPVTTPEFSWDGPYIGVTFAESFGTQAYDFGGYYFTGALVNVMAGYNFSMGRYVYGAEVGYTVTGDAHEQNLNKIDEYPQYGYSRILDLKGRLGYRVGRFLPYGTLGYSTAHWNEDGTAYRGSGFLFGAGVDYALGDRGIIGADVTLRDLPTDYPFEARVGTVGVRFGYRF